MRRTTVSRVSYAKHGYENILDGPGVARAGNFGRGTTWCFCRIGGPKIALRFCPQLFPCGKHRKTVRAQRVTLCSVRITNDFYRVIYRVVNNRDITEVRSLKGREKEQEKLFKLSRSKIKRARQKQHVHKHLFDNFSTLTRNRLSPDRFNVGCDRSCLYQQ